MNPSKEALSAAREVFKLITPELIDCVSEKSWCELAAPIDTAFAPYRAKHQRMLDALHAVWGSWCCHEQLDDPDWEGYETMQKVLAALKEHHEPVA